MLAESKLLSRVILSNLRLLRYPYKLSFAVTYRCNLQCGMCFIWKKPRVQEVTVQEFESFFKHSNHFSWIGLTGGEIFLRNDLLDIVKITLKYCKDLCVLHFPTNGYLKEKIVSGVKAMLALKPRRLFVTISVDGPQHIHDALRGVEGSWKNAVETFMALREMPGMRPYISMTISHGNSGLIDETIRSLKEVYPQFDPETMMNINFFQKSPHYYGNDHFDLPDKRLLLQDARKAMAVIGRKVTIKNYLQRNYLELYELFLDSGKSPLPCQALSASCFINPYGDVFPCAIYDRTIGNIKDRTFKLDEAWKRKDVAALRHDCMTGNCPGCWSPCDAYQAINGNLWYRGGSR